MSNFGQKNNCYLHKMTIAIITNDNNYYLIFEMTKKIYI
ncbi:hypothetical protein SASC598O02_011300 [Snodgrassella alvi SCGC AB-598-O02]|nr:hypothetical protein SASC598O02_011300 [Snodgrassella alvi SCGC AB-598-O02]